MSKKTTIINADACKQALSAFPAEQLLKIQRAEDAAAGKAADARALQFNLWIDSLHAAGVPKTEAGCAQVAFAITNHQAMVDATASGLLASKTVTAYAQGAQRALVHGVAWTARLFLDPAMKLPWSAGAGGRPAGKGKGKTTTPAAAKPEQGAANIGAPADAETARLFIAGQLATLVAYGNKHMKLLDLTTRDVLPALDKLSQTLKNVGKPTKE